MLPTWELKILYFHIVFFFERIVSEFGIITSFLGILGGLIYYPLFILFYFNSYYSTYFWRTEVNQFTLEMCLVLGIEFLFQLF